MKRFLHNLASFALSVCVACLTARCEAARPWLHELSSTEQGELSSLILSYSTDDEIHWHMNINHQDPQSFFHGHRAYIQRLERYLIENDGGRFVPLPKWDPARPIPEPFRVARFDHQQLENHTVNLPVPMAFRGPILQQFDGVPGLFEAVDPYHSEVHVRIGGCMADPMTAPAAPIFFCWHALLDDIFEEWASMKGYRIPDSFEQEFPDRFPHSGPGRSPTPKGPVDHGCICGPKCQCGPSCQCPPRQRPPLKTPRCGLPGGCPNNRGPKGGYGNGGYGYGGYGYGGYGNGAYGNAPAKGDIRHQFAIPGQALELLKPSWRNN